MLIKGQVLLHPCLFRDLTRAPRKESQHRADRTTGLHHGRKVHTQLTVPQASLWKYFNTSVHVPSNQRDACAIDRRDGLASHGSLQIGEWWARVPRFRRGLPVGLSLV